MKITATLPTRTKIGTLTTYMDVDMNYPEFYHLDDERVRPVFRFLPRTHVLVDYDFQAKRRVVAASRMTYRSVAAVSIIPLCGAAYLAAWCVWALASDLFCTVRYTVERLAEDASDFLGFIHHEIVRSFRADVDNLLAR